MADTVSGGRYLVNGALVDAWGKPVEEQPQAEAVQPAPDAPISGSIDDYTLDELRSLARGIVPGYTNKNKAALWQALQASQRE